MNQFNSKLEGDGIEARDTAIIQSMSLATKLPSFAAKYVFSASVDAVEIVSKTGKHVLKIFRSSWEIWDLSEARSRQEEWLRRLQPRTVAIIQPDNPTPDQLAYINRQTTEQERLSEEADKFWESLVELETTEEVQTKFRMLNIPFTLPP